MTFEIEEMDHLGNLYVRDTMHHLQQEGSPTEVRLLWIVCFDPYNAPEPTEHAFKFVSVKIPKNLAISQLNRFSADIEHALHKKFESVKKANFVMSRVVGADYWQFETNVPWRGVLYQ